MAAQKKFFRCSHCGNLVGLIHESGQPLICCGDKMTLLVPNTSDGATEKHVPVLTREGNKLHVAVGSIAHPMTEAHLIEWIFVVQGNHSQRVALTAADVPAADFSITEGPVFVYEYCNLHGLWIAEG